MKVVKLKTLKELRDSGIFKLSIEHNMIGFTRIGTTNPTYYLSDDYFSDEPVLATCYKTLHPNLFVFMPEIVKEETGVNYINEEIYNKLKTKFSALDRVISNNYDFELSELRKKVKEQSGVINKLKDELCKEKLKQ